MPSSTLDSELQAIIERYKAVDEMFASYLDNCLHVWNTSPDQRPRFMAALERSTPADNSSEVKEMGRELMSRHAATSELIEIILTEMPSEFEENPGKTLIDAESIYRKRIMENLRKLPRPDSPITLHYSFREHVKGATNAGD